MRVDQTNTTSVFDSGCQNKTDEQKRFAFARDQGTDGTKSLAAITPQTDRDDQLIDQRYGGVTPSSFLRQSETFDRTNLPKSAKLHNNGYAQDYQTTNKGE